jgi:hypothetical protein
MEHKYIMHYVICKMVEGCMEGTKLYVVNNDKSKIIKTPIAGKHD